MLILTRTCFISAFRNGEKTEIIEFVNDVNGIKDAVCFLKNLDIGIVVMESTDPFWIKFAEELSNAGISCVIGPS